MRGGGTANADGFGAGWYPPAALRRLARGQVAEAAPGAAPHGDPGAWPPPEPDVVPARYRSDRPIWADASFAALAAVTVGTAVLGAVRNATPGMPVTTAAAAPFAEGPWL